MEVSRYALATAYFGKSIELAPNASVHKNRAWAYEELKYYTQAIDFVPMNTEVYNHRGWCNVESKKLRRGYFRL